MLGLGLVFRSLVDTLERIGIPYMLGGSIASSIHGIYRYTNDIDIAAQFTHNQISLLAKELAADFYADAEAMANALKRGRSFEVIHLASSSKFVFFPVTGDPYSRLQLDRRKTEELAFDMQVTLCPVSTAEDVILTKLVGDGHWNDLRGVRSVQAGNLDLNYLRHWADHLKVRDLLERLMNEVTRQ